MRAFEHDVFFLLGNAYRVAEGQIPHRDFSSSWGAVIYLVDAAGLLLSRMRPDGIAYANALFAALTGIWAYRIGRTRLCAAAACCMGIYTVLLTAAPFALGFNPVLFTHAMIYNRFGFALLGIILVECASHALGLDSDAGDGTSGAVSSGAALALLGFLKISYAFAAVPFLLLGYGCGSKRGKRFFTLCAASATATALFFAYLRFDVIDLFRDLAMAADARSRSWQPGQMFTLGVGQVSESVPLVLLAAALMLIGRSEPRLKSALPLGELLLALVTLGAGGFLMSTNFQPATLPLNVFAALVLGNTFLIRLRGVQWFGLPALAIMLLTTVCVAPSVVSHAVSVAAAARESRQPDASAVRLLSERGSSMIFGRVASQETTETGGPAYVEALNDGLNLLRRRTSADDGVLAIDMFNPFNYLLGRRTPLGGMACAAYNFNFSDAAHPTEARFFGDARCVMVRKYSRAAGDSGGERYHVEGLYRLYRAALEERFTLLEETPHWRLYGLRARTQAAPSSN